MNHIDQEFTQFGQLLSAYLTPSADGSSVYVMKSDLQTCFDGLTKRLQTVFREVNHLKSQLPLFDKCSRNFQMKNIHLDELFETSDFNSQLASCAKIASILFSRISSEHLQLTQLLNQLKQCGDSVSITLSAAYKLNPDSEVLDICSSLVSVCSQLKHIQSLLSSSEQVTSDTVQIIYAFKQKLEEGAKADKTETSNPLTSVKHTSVQTDSLTKDGGLKQQLSLSQNCIEYKNASGKLVNYETLLKYGLVNPRNVLNRALKNSINTDSDEPTKSELQEALLNALSQLDRLKKYRSTQKTRMDQLHERLDHMSSELDASVDTIRYHQTNYEAQKRRNAMETAHLRSQLAKTTTLLEQYKLLVSKANLTTSNSLNQNIQVFIGSSTNNEAKSLYTDEKLQNIDSLSMDDLKLRLSITQNELNQLRLDMVHQREDGDREASRLRGQLAEVSSDARALRIQLNRLLSQNIASNKINSLENTNSSDSVNCTNCQKLQRLNDLLQRKQSKMSPIPDLITHQGKMMTCDDVFPKNHVVTQKTDYTQHVLDNSVQTDSLSCIDTPNKVPKADIAVDPIDVFVSSSAHPKCKSTQTEFFLMSGDMLPNESSLAGEIPLVGEMLGYECGNEFPILKGMQNGFHAYDKHTSPVYVQSPSVVYDEALTIHSSQTLSSCPVDAPECSDLVNTNKDVSEDVMYSQLLRRAKAAEEEAAMAMDQLKASNAEFLTLRERLSHATVERAHLKASIEGLDEQVTLLEESLYERTQELRQCQMLLEQNCPTYQKPTMPHSVEFVSEAKLLTPQTTSKTQSPIITNTYVDESTVVNLKGLLQFYQPTQSFICSSFTRSNWNNRFVKVNDRLSILLKHLILLSNQVISRIPIAIQYTSFRLQSQPRPKPMLIFLIYFIFVHLLLFHCWLF
ncbi:unnamed protein product [Heterobilharzia americana]|nr:unnamed protein product [Heterobilharzia americana]